MRHDGIPSRVLLRAEAPSTVPKSAGRPVLMGLDQDLSRRWSLAMQWPHPAPGPTATRLPRHPSMDHGQHMMRSSSTRPNEPSRWMSPMHTWRMCCNGILRARTLVSGTYIPIVPPRRHLGCSQPHPQHTPRSAPRQRSRWPRSGNVFLAIGPRPVV